VTNKSLKATDSWDLRGAKTEKSTDCNLWLACGGKMSIIPFLSQKEQLGMSIVNCPKTGGVVGLLK
jgi:hypothetical protein